MKHYPSVEDTGWSRDAAGALYVWAIPHANTLGIVRVPLAPRLCDREGLTSWSVTWDALAFPEWLPDEAREALDEMARDATIAVLLWGRAAVPCPFDEFPPLASWPTD